MSESLDSDTTRTPSVPTRTNSPSDDALTNRSAQLPDTLQLQPGEEIPPGFEDIIETKSNAEGVLEAVSPQEPARDAEVNPTERGLLHSIEDKLTN